MKDLTILMDLQIGRPADMLGELAERDIRIVAACVFPRLGGRVAHVAANTDDVATISDVVERHGGMVVDERDCVILPSDHPGGAVGAARAVADAGVMVNVGYFGARGEIVLATPDIDAAREALGVS